MTRRLFAVSLALLGSIVAPAPAGALVCDGSLSPPPQPTWAHTILADVGRSPQAGRWAVGTRTEFGSVTKQVAISEHRGAAGWDVVQMANARAFEPKALTVLGDRAWVAGRRSDPTTGGDAGSSIQRWNGSRWVQAALPPIAHAQTTSIWAIDGSSPRDVWAGGATIVNGAWRVVMLHWDGLLWTRVPAPLPLPVDQSNGDFRLDSIAVASPTDAWAVGYAFPNGQQSFALHWDGAAWSEANPNVPDSPMNNALNAVAAEGTDAWAVGTAGGADSLVFRWNGTGWTREPAPDAGFDWNELDAVAIGRAVLVGGNGYDGLAPSLNPEFFRWDEASGWQQLTSPYPLTSLDVSRVGHVMATGYETNFRILEGCLG
jgi:hypothetical protein